MNIIFSLVSAFSQKSRHKMALGVCLCKVFVFPYNFQTSDSIVTKFRLHIVTYRNSPTAFIPFLNFENCAREKFLKFIFSLHLINMGNFQTHIMPLIYDLEAASWRKRLDARLPPLGSRVRVSVPPCGFRGGRNGVWVSLSRGFSRFPLPKFHSTISPHSSHPFRFISSALLMVRQAWSVGTLATHGPII